MLVYENGDIFGTIGGGALEKKVIEQAFSCFSTKMAIKVQHNLVNELAMCCGGSVELFLEPLMNRYKLYVFGAGHIGKALAKFARDLEFNVTLIDARIDAFEGFDEAEFVCIKDHHSLAIESLEFDEKTMVVVLTHDHAHDREIVALTAKKNKAYLGMVGSARKVEIAKKSLLANQLMTAQEIAQVDMPIGLPIKAVTPAEIAVSILAKLIQVRSEQEAQIF